LAAALVRTVRHLASVLGRPSSDAAAYAQHVETGLRLNTVAEVPRFRRLARDWSRDLQPIRLRHVDLQLEVAALARSVDLLVEYERSSTSPAARAVPPMSSSAPSQGSSSSSASASTRTAQQDLPWNLDLRLQMASIERDLSISGHWDVRLPPEETTQLLAEATAATDEVRATQRTASIRWRLRVDLLDGTWLLSQWAQRDLPDKTQWMTGLLAEALKSLVAAIH
jgi:hypothetical protein